MRGVHENSRADSVTSTIIANMLGLPQEASGERPFRRKAVQVRLLMGDCRSLGLHTMTVRLSRCNRRRVEPESTNGARAGLREGRERGKVQHKPLLRHTVATFILENGVDIGYFQEMPRHEARAMEQTYT
jgi:integrase